MRRRSTTLVLGAVAVVGVTLLTGNATATPSVGLTTTILAKSTFDSTQLSGFARLDDGKGFPKPSDVWLVYLKTHGLTDGYVVDNVIEVGGTTGWHSHPGPSIIFVIRGTVTNYNSDVKGCAGRDYAAGSSFTDPGGRDVHMLKNNGTVQAETIAVQLLPTGAARKTDAAAPAGCPAS
jgi:hypothetical protein